MSSLKVEIVTLDKIEAHPNADRLEIGWVSGWQVVIPKGVFDVTTLCVYFPIDSILPEALEAKLFSPDSKIKLSKRRIKTIKIRGAISQGLLVRVDEVFTDDYGLFVGKDVADTLGVTKYEPPEPTGGKFYGKQTSKRQSNPNFHKYTSIENFKWYPNLYQPGEIVYVTEKIHGTNFRAGWVPYFANTWWKRLKQLLHLAPKYEFVYGSHNVQFQDTPRKKGFYGPTLGKNVYAEAVEKYNLRNKLKFGEVIYAEIYGDGIQKGYLYSCKPGERKMVVIDMKLNGEYVSHLALVIFCAKVPLPVVPLDTEMPYDEVTIRKLVDAPSWLGSELREGVVIKPVTERTCVIGRKILKWKSSEFLLKAVDDTH